MNIGIVNHESAISFITAGRSIFTLKNSKTENRFTYKVTKHKTDDIYFVSVLTNPDQFTFIGIITKDFSYKHSKKSKISIESKSVNVISYVMAKLIEGNLNESVEIWHEGRCGRCGRPLTVPESIETGLGPECARKLSKK